MTIRYVSLARAPKAWSSDEYGWQERPTLTVWEGDPSPTATGLLDAEGTPLYRVQERVSLGFDLMAGGRK